MRSPTRRAALAVCVALLLVTAGCSGGTNPTSTATTNSAATTATSAPTSTVTATTSSATTTTGTWTPNASAEQYPPGVAENGTLANVSTLVDAHVNATANQSMALSFETTGPNGTSVSQYAYGANQTPYYTTVDRTTDGERIVQGFYRTGSHGYTKTVLPDETRYSVLQNDTTGIVAWNPDGMFGPSFDLHYLLAGGSYSVNGTVERDGRTLVQLTTDEISQNPPGFLTEYEGTALVTPDGVVYNLDASSGTGPDDTTEEHYESSVTLDTDVEWSGAPSWVADVPHLSVSIVEDGHAVEIRNTGGAALPANASLNALGDNETSWGPRSASFGDVNGTVTTDARLEPGDAVYVTAGADGNSSSFALHDERTRGRYNFGFAGLRGTHENVTYRLATGFKAAENE